VNKYVYNNNKNKGPDYNPATENGEHNALAIIKNKPQGKPSLEAHGKSTNAYRLK